MLLLPALCLIGFHGNSLLILVHNKIYMNAMLTVTHSKLLTITTHYKQIVAKILLEQFPVFGKLKAHMPKAICHLHEKKYSDCVDILDQLEKWTEEIFSAAGLCASSKESANNTTPVIAAHSRPDQPASHVPPATSESDPLHGVKIPCFGDQLT